jgi:alkanesulfonate monooxygenase SsuD/methylene tetrahydromethanopterin reductase-like flavin-dependent oxidoreductase (luciferase family)
MWTNERFGFEGEYFSMPVRAVLPKPYQKPHPPMWVAVSTPGTELDAADRGMGALGVNFTTFKQQEERVEEYRRRIHNCTPAGEIVTDQLASANFLYVHEETEKGLGTGGRMLRDFQYMAGQLDMAKEAYPTKGYPSPGLLAATRRQASGPASAGEPPEGIAIGNPDQVTRELKKWEATGVDRINFLLNAAEVIPQEEVLESLRVFARDVMPHFD